MTSTESTQRTVASRRPRPITDALAELCDSGAALLAESGRNELARTMRRAGGHVRTAAAVGGRFARVVAAALESHGLDSAADASGVIEAEFADDEGDDPR